MTHGRHDVRTDRPLHPDPARRRDDPGAGQPARGRGRAQPGQRPRPRRRAVPAAPAGRARATSPASASPRSCSRTAYRSAVERRGRRARARRGLGARRRPTPASRTRASPGCPSLGVHVMTYVAYGPLGPRLALAVSEDLRTGSASVRCTSATSRTCDTDLNLFPNKDAVFFPEPVPDPDGTPSLRHAAPADVGPRLVPRRARAMHLPAGVTDDRARASGSPTCRSTRSRRTSAPSCTWPSHRLVALPRVPVRGAEDRRRAAAAARRRGLAAASHHGVTGELLAVGVRPDQPQRVDVRRRRDDPRRRRPRREVLAPHRASRS